MIELKTKSNKDRQNKQKSSLQNLEKLREMFRIQAEKAVMQIKENQMLSLQEIREAEDLFDNIQEANKFLKSRNQLKKKKNHSKDKDKQDNSLSKEKKKSKLNKRQQKNKEVKQPKQLKKDKNKDKVAQYENKQVSKEKRKERRSIPSLQFDQTRKWNEVLENPKTGKFQPEQKRILAESLSQYLVKNNIDLDTIINDLTTPQLQKNPNNLKMWTTVCSVLPNRTLHSTYTYLIRKITNRKNSKWTQQEQQQLFSLVQRYGNKWRLIGRKMGRAGQNVRDKYRNLSKKNQTKIWKIQQIITFLKQIQKQSQNGFLKQGIESLLEQSQAHNNQEQQLKQIYKYNSKFMLSHNNVQALDYIDASGFGGVKRDKIRWKVISDKIKTKSQLECKNKYLQFMEIMNRDYRGIDEGRVIKFLKDQADRRKEFSQCNIRWDLWDQEETATKLEEAKCKWLMVKKKIKNRGEKSFKQLLEEAEAVNQRKRQKTEKRFEKIKQQEQISKKRRQEKRKKQEEKQLKTLEKKNQKDQQNDKQKQVAMQDEQIMVNNQKQSTKHKRIQKQKKTSHVAENFAVIIKQKKHKKKNQEEEKPLIRNTSQNLQAIILLDENSYEDKSKSENQHQNSKEQQQQPSDKNGLLQIPSKSQNQKKPKSEKPIKRKRKDPEEPQIKKMNLDFMNRK